MAWQMKARQHRARHTRAQRHRPRHQRRFQGRAASSIYRGCRFPIGPQRKSGFLFPSIGGSSRSGAEIEVPYYWNIRPNVDFTAEPVYYSRRGLDLAGELRFLTPRGSAAR